jgi:hypothetical protein
MDDGLWLILIVSGWMVKIPYSDIARSQGAITKPLGVFSKDQFHFGGYGKLGSFLARHYTLG